MGRRAARGRVEAVGAAPRRLAALPLLVLAQAALASCAAGGASGPRPARPAAVFEVAGGVPDVAGCLLAAYADDPFRFRVAEDGTGVVRITAFGAPSGRDPRRSRPRFSVEVGRAGRGVVRVSLRTAWTLLGPGAEIERLRARLAACGPRGAAADTPR